jgi:hypothetical protein
LGNLRYTVNEDYFKKIDSSNKAYWLGFILTDGNIYEKPNSTSKTFQLNLQQNDFEHLVKLKIEIASNNTVDLRTYGSNKSAQFRVYNRNFIANLVAKGINPRKSGNCKPLECIPKKFTRDFYRGFLDGDGTIYYNKGKNYYSLGLVGDKQLVLGFQDYCTKIVPNSNKITPDGTIFCWKVGGEKALKLMEHFYKDAETSLNRKKALAEKALNVSL